MPLAVPSIHIYSHLILQVALFTLLHNSATVIYNNNLPAPSAIWTIAVKLSTLGAIILIPVTWATWRKAQQESETPADADANVDSWMPVSIEAMQTIRPDRTNSRKPTGVIWNVKFTRKGKSGSINVKDRYRYCRHEQEEKDI